MFRIQKVWMGVLPQNQICEWKCLLQNQIVLPKLCFKFKMFEWKRCFEIQNSCCETKLFQHEFGYKPFNWKSCLKTKFWEKRSSCESNVFQHESYFEFNIFALKVLVWNQSYELKKCCETKLCSQKPCFEFNMFEWKCCVFET